MSEPAPDSAKRPTWRVGAAAAAAAVLSVLAVASPAVEAGSPPPPAPSMTVDPTVVRYPSTIQVSGTGYVDPDTGLGTGMQVVMAAERLGAATIDNYDPTLCGLATPAEDGSWVIDAIVDTREPYVGPLEDTTTSVTATCGRSLTDIVFSYDPIAVRYEAMDAPTTAPTTSTTSTPQQDDAGPSIAGGATDTG